MIIAEDIIKNGAHFFHATLEGIEELIVAPGRFKENGESNNLSLILENCFYSFEEAKERCLVLLLTEARNKKIDSEIRELEQATQEIGKIKRLEEEREKLLKIKRRD